MATFERGDLATALKEFRPLAEQGHAAAQSDLGFMYFKGDGVSQNDAEAVKWWRKAAGQGYVDAQVNLGFMYGTGKGVSMNYVKAYMWYLLANAQGQKEAANNLDIIKNEMTPAQIAEAQAFATEWWEKHNN